MSSSNLLTAKGASHKPRHPAIGALYGTLIAVFVVLAMITVLIVPFWFVSDRVYGHMERGRDEMELAQKSVETLQFAAARDHIDRAEEEFIAGRIELSRLDPLRELPYIGPHLVAADRLLVSGSAASSAVRDVLGVAEDILGAARETEGLSGALTGVLPPAATIFKDLTPEAKRRILATFAESVPDIRSAIDKIDVAIAAFDEIPTDDIAAQFRKTLAPIRERLVTLRAGLVAVLPIAETVPRVLGFPSARTYLIFFENNTEMRPTGGFLGVYGLATVKDADLAAMTTDDIYAIDGPSEGSVRPPPPEPIRKYIGIDKWYLRDANWSPDFVVSAQVMEKFFIEEVQAVGAAPPHIDGVFAVTPQLAQDLLRIVGPITVDGKTFTADNLVDALEFAVERSFVQEGIPFHARKDIVGKLLKEMIARLTSLSVRELMQVVALVHRNLEEGHVLIAMKDPDLQATVLNNDWGGKLHIVRGDYLTVIDANLASLKTDPAVHRAITYAVSPGKDGHVGSVRITYDHKGRFDWKTTRYRTYTRVYLPAGTEFLGVVGAMENDKLKDPARRPGKADIGDELGRKVFGAFISIEPGEKRTLEFRFKLAPAVAKMIADGKYGLEIEKQPGTVAHGLTLDLDLGKKLTNAEPPENRKEWGDAHYRFSTDLRVDRGFVIDLEP